MVTAEFDQLVKELKALPREKKHRLVERLVQEGFFDDNRTWKRIERGSDQKIPPGSDGRSLLRFAGTIDSGDLMTIQRAIEEGCEVVDQEGW